MEKKVSKENIIELVRRFPEGASLEEILIGLDSSISRRTLQRRLSALVQEKHLTTTGKARSLRYKLTKQPKEKHFDDQSMIPLSEEGKKIQLMVTKEIQKRNFVGYNKNFLKSYSPNITYYLSTSLRQKLALLGGTQDGRYPAGTYAKLIFHRLLIDLSWNSSRLEGNTYSLLETERLLDSGKAAKGKNLQETQMILNHKAAIEFLVHSAKDIGVNRYTILNLHTLLADNLLSDSAACGRLRSFPVGIEKSVYTPMGIPQVIDECFNLLIHTANQIQDPFELAFFLMVQLPYLQPFDDVNKRVSRLAANISLIQSNFCPLSFIDVPQNTYINALLGVYELNRIELLRDVFEWAYERSCALYSITKKAIAEPDPFRIEYRDEIHKIIQDIVCNQVNRKAALKMIKKAAQHIKTTDQNRFIEVVEKELQSLHEGNIARYHLQLRDFKSWEKGWV